MTNQIQTCPDNHHCLNGSKCVQNPYDEGSYYCDCDEVIWDVRYEGLHCEHKAEIYCNGPNTKGLDEWFCTNGGTCHIESGEEKEGQWACDCPENFEGSFCQFVKGTKPKGYPFYEERSPTRIGAGGSLVGGLIGSFITLLVIGIVAVAVFYRRRQEIVQFTNSYFGENNTHLRGKEAIERSMKLASYEFHKNEPKNRSRKQSTSPVQYETLNVHSTESADHVEMLADMNQRRPDTRQSETGVSYAEEEDLGSMASFT